MSADRHGQKFSIWPVQNDSKHTEASFSPIPKDSFALQVVQMPRSPRLAIFVTMTTDIQTDYFTLLRMRVRGNYGKSASLVPRPHPLRGKKGLVI